MKELINELKYNQNINYKKALENRVNIDYIIERLTDIKKEIDKHINDRINFLNSMINYNLENNEDEAIKYMYSKLELTIIKNMIEGKQDENNN